jgi:hypothetical protein
MADTAVESGPRLIAFVLRSVPESVPAARFHVRATLGFHGLGEYANDVEAITSELVTNAVRHVCDDGTETIGIALARAGNPASVTVIVSDSSPEAPIRRDTSTVPEPSPHTASSGRRPRNVGTGTGTVASMAGSGRAGPGPDTLWTLARVLDGPFAVLAGTLEPATGAMVPIVYW